jgi:hypothetical protein
MDTRVLGSWSTYVTAFQLALFFTRRHSVGAVPVARGAVLGGRRTLNESERVLRAREETECKSKEEEEDGGNAKQPWRSCSRW